MQRSEEEIEVRPSCSLSCRRCGQQIVRSQAAANWAPRYALQAGARQPFGPSASLTAPLLHHPHHTCAACEPSHQDCEAAHSPHGVQAARSGSCGDGRDQGAQGTQTHSGRQEQQDGSSSGRGPAPCKASCWGVLERQSDYSRRVILMVRERESERERERETAAVQHGAPTPGQPAWCAGQRCSGGAGSSLWEASALGPMIRARWGSSGWAGSSLVACSAQSIFSPSTNPPCSQHPTLPHPAPPFLSHPPTYPPTHCVALLLLQALWLLALSSGYLVERAACQLGLPYDCLRQVRLPLGLLVHTHSHSAPPSTHLLPT